MYCARQQADASLIAVIGVPSILRLIRGRRTTTAMRRGRGGSRSARALMTSRPRDFLASGSADHAALHAYFAASFIATSLGSYPPAAAQAEVLATPHAMPPTISGP